MSIGCPQLRSGMQQAGQPWGIQTIDGKLGTEKVQRAGAVLLLHRSLPRKTTQGACLLLAAAICCHSRAAAGLPALSTPLLLPAGPLEQAPLAAAAAAALQGAPAAWHRRAAAAPGCRQRCCCCGGAGGPGLSRRRAAAAGWPPVTAHPDPSKACRPGHSAGAGRGAGRCSRVGG